MKIDFGSKADNMSGLEAQTFGVVATPHVYKALYSSLYEDKEQVTLGELAANALDAQRANGTEHIPVKIQLPTKLNPELVVTDVGVGMSLEVVQDVYVNYGASTKRGDNVDIGGFGFGCKSPFSLTSGFTIETTHKGITTHAGFFLDNGTPQYIIYSSEEEGKEDGTIVTVPIADEESQRLLDERAHQVFVLWEVPPEFTGLDREYVHPEPIHKTDTVLYFNKSQLAGRAGVSSYSYENLQVVAVGPYIYRIPNNMLSRLYDSEMIQEHLHGGGDCLAIPYFDVGDLELSPTRERIEDTDKNYQIIHNTVCTYLEELLVVIPKPTMEQRWDWVEYLFENSVYSDRVLAVDPVDGSVPEGQKQYMFTRPHVAIDYIKKTYGAALEDPIAVNILDEQWRMHYEEKYEMLKEIQDTYHDKGYFWFSRSHLDMYAISPSTLPKNVNLFRELHINLEHYEYRRLRTSWSGKGQFHRVQTNYPAVGGAPSGVLFIPDRAPRRFWDSLREMDWNLERTTMPITKGTELDNQYIAGLKEIDPDLPVYSLEETLEIYREGYEKLVPRTRKISGSRSTANRDANLDRPLGHVLSECGSPHVLINRDFYKNEEWLGKNKQKDVLVIAPTYHHSDYGYQVSCLFRSFPEAAERTVVVSVDPSEARTVRLRKWAEENFTTVYALENGEGLSSLLQQLKELDWFVELMEEYFIGYSILSQYHAFATNRDFFAEAYPDIKVAGDYGAYHNTAIGLVKKIPYTHFDPTEAVSYDGDIPAEIRLKLIAILRTTSFFSYEERMEMFSQPMRDFLYDIALCTSSAEYSVHRKKFLAKLEEGSEEPDIQAA